MLPICGSLFAMNLDHEQCKRKAQEHLLNRSRRIRSIKREMDQLLSGHVRYEHLEEELAKELHSTSTLIGLLGTAGVAETKKNAEATADEDRLALEQTLSERQRPQELRDILRLWRAVREVVRLAGESSVGEIQRRLASFGIEGVTRQAIESALRQHKDEFEVTKRGRERYVDLK
jgi:hypothetical protein